MPTMKKLSYLVLLLLITSCGGIDKEKAKVEFKSELDKIANDGSRYKVIQEVNKICGDIGYIEMHFSKDDALEFRRDRLNMTPLQEKGIKAICPRYW